MKFGSLEYLELFRDTGTCIMMYDKLVINLLNSNVILNYYHMYRYRYKYDTTSDKPVEF